MRALHDKDKVDPSRLRCVRRYAALSLSGLKGELESTLTPFAQYAVYARTGKGDAHESNESNMRYDQEQR